MATRLRQKANGLPLYRQLYLVLKEAIESGSLGASRVVPSEHDLCREYGVSRVTVRRALRDLARDDLIVKRQGASTIARSSVPVQPFASPMEDYINYVESLADATQARLIEFGYEVPPETVQKAMGLAADVKVQRTVRVRSFNSVPFMVLTVYTPEHIGRRFAREDVENEALVRLLRRNANFASAEQYFSAALADAMIAKLLNIPVGSALTHLTSIIFDDKNEVVEYLSGLARPDMYRIRNTLKLAPESQSRSKK
ncbi:MAG TPA: GntR family transcriptional regulator [Bordetella sp.]|nr:GntR family transcriptional regulator [Bordetella sp.]